MKDELKKEIGRRMKEIRKTIAYTQEEMVSSFEIGRANYSRIENGEVSPNPQILYTLRTKFNISLDWLIIGSGKMFVQDRDKKASEKKKEFSEYREEIEDLLHCIETVPMVKHSMLSFFLEYKAKHKKILQNLLKPSGYGDMNDEDANNGQ